MENIYYFSKLSKRSGCFHLVTTKNSKYAFNFSLALHTGERQSDILNNRRVLKENFPNMHFIVANQTHSSNIKVIYSQNELGWSSQKDAISNCDALITIKKISL